MNQQGENMDPASAVLAIVVVLYVAQHFLG